MPYEIAKGPTSKCKGPTSKCKYIGDSVSAPKLEVYHDLAHKRCTISHYKIMKNKTIRKHPFSKLIWVALERGILSFVKVVKQYVLLHDCSYWQHCWKVVLHTGNIKQELLWVIEGSQGRSSNRILDAGSDADSLEKCCLLGCSSWLAQPAFL